MSAGRHCEDKRPEYSKLCKLACRKGAALLKEGKSALDAATEAVTFLEDSAITNAGYGSNLTWDGTVECDASVMDGTTLLWGAVGAAAGLKNPCRVAKEICLRQQKLGTLGRVPPCLLVGLGANDWAKSNGLHTVDPVKLIHASTLKKYNKYKKRVLNQQKIDDLNCDLRTDTVGSVCVDKQGCVAAVCSSGGIILKHSGRLGQAAAFGAGCWAEDNGVHPVAVCTTGCGEHLIRSTLARTVASRINQDSAQPSVALVSSAMRQDFLDSPFLKGIDEKMGGVLALNLSPQEECGELLWGHTTETMAIGYMHVSEKPIFKISYLPTGKVSGKSLIVEGTTFKFCTT